MAKNVEDFSLKKMGFIVVLFNKNVQGSFVETKQNNFKGTRACNCIDMNF